MPTYEHKCLLCDNIQDEVYSSKEITNDEKDKMNFIQCKNCKTIGNMKRIITGGSGVAMYSSSSPEQQKAMLKERSQKHFKRELEDKFHSMNKKNFIPGE